MLTWKDIIHLATNGNKEPDTRVEKTEAEWKSQLTPEQYYITRQKGTERAFSGEHCSRYDPGVYECVCCNTPLFDSNLKFDSSSGWPSFTEPVKDNVIDYINVGGGSDITINNDGSKIFVSTGSGIKIIERDLSNNTHSLSATTYFNTDNLR